MRTSLKVTAFTAVLAATFAGALGVGQVFGAPVEASAGHSMESMGKGMSGMEMPAGPAAGASMPPGLQVSESGYTFGDVSAPARAGENGKISFSILDAAGSPVTEFAELHEKQLHLIILRQDTSGFRHVHPELDDQGVWSIDWSWENSGSYKVYADFQPEALGRNITLSRVVDVAGDFAPKPLPALSNADETDGYQVQLNGSLQAGKSEALTATLERDGVPVENLDPYLGSYGHLVAIRTGDLAYLHVHPEGEPGDGKTKPGPDVTFFAEAPTAGTYRLFLDFKVEGTVRTAEFTVEVKPDGQAGSTTAPAEEKPADGQPGEEATEGAGDHAKH
jgi:hypothetical protein